jgi:hypothetical protein
MMWLPPVLSKLVRLKPPAIRNWPLGQTAVADLVSPDLMKIVAWGVGLDGLRNRPHTVWMVISRGVVELRWGRRG